MRDYSIPDSGSFCEVRVTHTLCYSLELLAPQVARIYTRANERGRVRKFTIYKSVGYLIASRDLFGLFFSKELLALRLGLTMIHTARFSTDEKKVNTKFSHFFPHYISKVSPKFLCSESWN